MNREACSAAFRTWNSWKWPAPTSACGEERLYEMEHPDVASGITKNKIQAVVQTRAEIVATGCPGCRVQIHGNLEDSGCFQVMHPVEILAMAMA